MNKYRSSGDGLFDDLYSQLEDFARLVNVALKPFCDALKQLAEAYKDQPIEPDGTPEKRTGVAAQRSPYGPQKKRHKEWT